MKELMKQKKGTLTLGNVPGLALTMVFIAAIFVGGYLVLAGLGNSSTDTSVTGAVQNMTSAFDNIVTYAPTWGTIVGVSVLIGIVIFGFAYAGKKGYM
jgi:hypothetical protein